MVTKFEVHEAKTLIGKWFGRPAIIQFKVPCQSPSNRDRDRRFKQGLSLEIGLAMKQGSPMEEWS